MRASPSEGVMMALPSAGDAIKKLPVIAREKMQRVSLPVQYEQACKALAECTQIDEAKLWGDKAEALAAWAKVYKNEKVLIESRRLKLHAYRRMGELALEMRPNSASRGKGGGSGRRGGPQSLLVENGLSRNNAGTAMSVARTTPKEFERLVREAKSPYSAVSIARGRGEAPPRSKSDAWFWLCSTHGDSSGMYGPGLNRVKGAFKSKSPKDLAAGIDLGEVKAARMLALELIEWLDEFERHLPRDDTQ